MDAVLGVDIGTSFAKAAACGPEGEMIAISRRACVGRVLQPASALIPAATWWHLVRDVIADLLRSAPTLGGDVKAICISAVAPTLVVFDSGDVERAFGLMYSWLPTGMSLAQCDRRLTECRLELLQQAACDAGLVAPYLTDLVGYLNFALTGVLTVNSISLAEMGFSRGAADCARLRVADVAPVLVAPAQRVGDVSATSAETLGLQPGIPVCGGCPDTLGSVVGSGMTDASQMMLYLGTFGSLLRLDSSVTVLVDSPHCCAPPFGWELSVPGLGPEVERLSDNWFPGNRAEDRLRLLDQASSRSAPGAGGMLFLVPRWRDSMRQVGQFALLPASTGPESRVSECARATLEGIAYAICALRVSLPEVIRVSGGGARSKPWLQALADVLRRRVVTQEFSWEAAGTADIAARLAWDGHCGRRSDRVFDPLAPGEAAETIRKNQLRATQVYAQGGWM